MQVSDAKHSPVSEATQSTGPTSPDAQQRIEANLFAEASGQSQTDVHAPPQLHAVQQAHQCDLDTQSSLHSVQHNRSEASSPDLSSDQPVAAISNDIQGSSSSTAAAAQHGVARQEAEQAETQSQQAEAQSQPTETQSQPAEIQSQQAETRSQAQESSSVADSLDSMQQGSWRDQWSRMQQPCRRQEPQHPPAAMWQPSELMKKMAAASRADQAQPIKVLFASAEEQQASLAKHPVPAEPSSLPISHLLQHNSHSTAAAIPISQPHPGHVTAGSALWPDPAVLQQQPDAGQNQHDSPAEEGTAGGEGDHNHSVTKRVLAASTAVSPARYPDTAQTTRAKVRRTSGEFQQVSQRLHWDLTITVQKRQAVP